MGNSNSSSGRVAETKRHSLLVDLVIRLVKEKPLGTVGAVITLLFLLAGIFADFIAPYGIIECDMGHIMAPPLSDGFLLGTDNLGRDMLSRIIFGARVSVIVGLTASLGGIIISIIIGVPSGYFGGKFDLIVQRFVDAWLCLPGLILMMVIISIVGASMWSLIIILALQRGILSSRLIRGVVIGIKENVYVDAAVAIGCSTPRILTRHILPHIMAPAVILFTAQVPGVIMSEAALSFLGYGIPPPAPSWGGMLGGTGITFMLRAPWMALWPGLALAIVVYGINMFGDAVRDLLDPRLRGGVGRYEVSIKKEATVKRGEK